MKEQSKLQGPGFWKEHFASWKVSGLTQQAYCSREGISYPSFVYQHSRANSGIKKASINFIEATIKPKSETQRVSGLQVILPNGVRLIFEGEMTAAFVQTAFDSAGRIPC